ncbi:MAG: amidohydrolase [Oscillospiraceae bacterium]|nr:amidohydrolase [Oscillospiraceae bacterium]
MRIVDAHAHLFPRGFAGFFDPRSGVTVLPHGKVRKRDGEEVPIMPESFADTGFPAGELLARMDDCGVSRAVLLANSITDPEENTRAVREYPGRFAAAMTIPQGDKAAEALRHWHSRGLTALKFEMSEGLGYTNPGWYPDFRLDDPAMEPVYALAGKLGVTIAVDPGRVGGRTYQTAALEAVTAAFPATRFVICHLGFPDVPMPDPARREAWHRMASLAKRPNVWFDFAALTDFCRKEAPDFPTPPRLVRAFADEFGAGKLLWGTDAPGALCTADYARLLGVYRDSPLFSASEKALLLGENARLAYGLEDN